MKKIYLLTSFMFCFLILFIEPVFAHIAGGGQQNEECYGDCCLQYSNGYVAYFCSIQKRTCKITCVCCCSYQSENGTEYFERIIGSKVEWKDECKKTTHNWSPLCNENEIIWTTQKCEQEMSWICDERYNSYEHCPIYDFPFFQCYKTISTNL